LLKPHKAQNILIMSYKIKIFPAVLTIFMFTFSSCKKEEHNPSNEIVERTAAPSQTDPGITTVTTGTDLQYAYLPKEASNRRDKLFVFLPGTFVGPKVYREILQAAARYGYYAIGIAYSNNQTVQSYCTGSDPTCASNIFREMLEGVDYSPLVTVSVANSFENRISKFLLYLKNNFPDENWERFLNNNAVMWDKISLAGHSQGSGHTLFISKNRNLLRATLFSGPYSFKMANGQVPAWMSSAGLTPNDKIYGFHNSLDGLTDWAEIQPTWNNIGLAGNFQSVDNTTNFNNAHKLFTNLDLPFALINPEHGSTVADENTPLDGNGNPVFGNVWRYMCFPD
jgi:hypothetical protein